MAQSTITKQMLVGLNLNGQGLFNVVAEHVTTTDLEDATKFPPQANVGRFVYNTTTNQLTYCNGTAWIGVSDVVVSSSNSGTITINGIEHSVFTITENGDVTRNESNDLVIGAGKVTTDKIADNAVTTNKIADNVVTDDKLATMPAKTFKGNMADSAGNAKNLSVANVKSMLGITGNEVQDVIYNDESLVGEDNKANLDSAFDHYTKNILKPNQPNGIATLDENGDVLMSQLKTNVASGLVTLDENIKIPTTYLPSYVDDVLEYADFNSFPTQGESGKIYVDLTTNKTYRWGSTQYTEISASLAIGETADTAFQGSRGVALEERVGKAELSIEQTNTNLEENITSIEGDITRIDGNLERLGDDINEINEQLDLKADKTEVESLNTSLTEQINSLETSLTEQINTKTTLDEVNYERNQALASGELALNVSRISINNGTSSQFLKADGSLDDTRYATYNELTENNVGGYVSKSGDTMSGNLDMGGNQITNVAIENVTSLPTENNFEGRQVTYDNRLYTYSNGNWLSIADDLGSRPETHEEEFIYQPTASDLSIKDGVAMIDKIKGKTLVWNQKSIDGWQQGGGATVTKISSYEYKVTSLNSGSGYNRDLRIDVASLPLNHKYLIKATINSVNVTQISVSIKNAKHSLNIQTGINEIGVILTPTDNSHNLSYFGIYNSYKDSDGVIKYDGYEMTVINPMIFDLTQMFGAGNEPSTVEEFEAMFPEDYYEYNEGTLLSHDSLGVKSVGFNLFDKKQQVVENISYSWSDGYTQVSYNGLNSTIDFVECLPNTVYYLSYIAVYEYDNNKVLIGSTGGTKHNLLYTTKSNARYFRFMFVAGNKDIVCINLSHSGIRNGEYEPYEEYTTQWANGKKISELTSNGKVIFPNGLLSAGSVYDEITTDDKGRSIAIKRIGSVDMGTLSWSLVSGFTSLFNAITEGRKIKGKIIQIKYNNINDPLPSYEYIDARDKSIGITGNDQVVIIKDSSYTDAASLKASLSGQILYYVLATPITYILDDEFNFAYQVRDFGTEEILYNNTTNLPNIPINADIEYGFNATDMIRGNYFEIKDIKKQLQIIDSEVIDNLSHVAFSGDYEHLINTPDLSVYATNEAVNAINEDVKSNQENISELNATTAANRDAISTNADNIAKVTTNVQALHEVARNGDYNTLSNKPTTLPNPNALTLSVNGTATTYDGSSAQSVSVVTAKYFVWFATALLSTSVNEWTILAKSHSCGYNPLVQTYLNGQLVDCDITIAANGDVTWRTAITITPQTDFRVVIMGF